MKNTLWFFVAPCSIFFCFAMCGILVGSCSDAHIASSNISEAVRNFEIDRRIVFYNGVTGDYMLTIEGRCAIGDSRKQLRVTCQIGESDYRKHYLGLSDNVTYFAEQLSPGDVSAFHHRITFKPQTILPDIDFRGSADARLRYESEAMQYRVTRDSESED